MEPNSPEYYDIGSLQREVHELESSRLTWQVLFVISMWFHIPVLWEILQTLG